MKINRGKGETPSEQALARLADRIFLNLWSYPNLYIDKKQGTAGDGKELCDLLVVFGNDVIIFSDKAIDWPSGTLDTAWKRWQRRAVEKSIDQIDGAERWIREFPERIFVDSRCVTRFPIPLPANDQMRIHRIVVATGAEEACAKYFDAKLGTFILRARRPGEPPSPFDDTPFVVNDREHVRGYVHVMSPNALMIVAQLMDSAPDFIAYLKKKEALFRSGKSIIAQGEEELAALYATHMNADGEHDFTKPDGSSFDDHSFVAIGGGFFDELTTNPRYLAKLEADKISYAWDRLIEQFTSHMLNGSTIIPDGGTLDLKIHEEGVRHMASVPRHMRRAFGEGIKYAFERSKEGHRFVRSFIDKNLKESTGFFFMTLAVPDFDIEGGYGRYRQVRNAMLETYALTFLQKYPHLKRVIGVGTEPAPGPYNTGGGSSEDLMLAEQPEWTPELVESLEKSREAYDIAREGRYIEHEYHHDEFPDAPSASAAVATYQKPKGKRARRRDRGKVRSRPRTNP